jgi:hypothetical protein
MASQALLRVPIDTVRITPLRTAWRTQARIAPGAMKELTRCVAARGLVQAVIVRRLTAASEYELIDGERRLDSAKQAGHTHIEVLVIEADDATAAAVCLMANLGAKRLKPIEMARLCALAREAGQPLPRSASSRVLPKRIQSPPKQAIMLTNCCAEPPARGECGHWRSVTTIPDAGRSLTFMTEDGPSTERAPYFRLVPAQP